MTYTQITELDGHLRLPWDWVRDPMMHGIGSAPSVEGLTASKSVPHIVPPEAQPPSGHGIGPEGHFRITVEFTPA